MPRAGERLAELVTERADIRIAAISEAASRASGTGWNGAKRRPNPMTARCWPLRHSCATSRTRNDRNALPPRNELEHEAAACADADHRRAAATWGWRDTTRRHGCLGWRRRRPLRRRRGSPRCSLQSRNRHLPTQPSASPSSRRGWPGWRMRRSARRAARARRRLAGSLRRPARDRSRRSPRLSGDPAGRALWGPAPARSGNDRHRVAPAGPIERAHRRI